MDSEGQEGRYRQTDSEAKGENRKMKYNHKDIEEEARRYLVTTVEFLKEYGISLYAYRDIKGRLCPVGALRMACFGGIKEPKRHKNKRVYHTAYKLLEKTIGFPIEHKTDVMVLEGRSADVLIAVQKAAEA